ncbi:HEAT repeat domain-containing protein [Variovorax paradoxus]|nr:HEAT repeat domain-containing protein [Variovorax paradoxus]
MSSTAFEPLVEFGLLAGATALGLNLLLAALIVALRARLKQRERDQQAFKSIWQPALMGALAGPESYRLPPLRPQDQLAFLKLWNYMHESLRGDATVRLNDIARQLRCGDFARRLLREGSFAERLLAMLTLGHLRDPHAWTALGLVAQATDTVASLNAAKAMIQIDPVLAAHQLLPAVLMRTDWEAPRVARMLGDAREAFASLLVPRIVGLPVAQKLRALELIEALRVPLPRAELALLLEARGEATIIAAALRVTNVPELRPDVLAHLEHPRWRVRMHAVDALARMARPSDVQRLAAMLTDREWWVRYRAAHALVGLAFPGHQDLATLKSLTEDSFGRDVLDHVFAERGLLSPSS